VNEQNQLSAPGLARMARARVILSTKPFTLLPALWFCICVAAAVASLTIFGFIRPSESGLYPGLRIPAGSIDSSGTVVLTLRMPDDLT